MITKEDVAQNCILCAAIVSGTKRGFCRQSIPRGDEFGDRVKLVYESPANEKRLALNPGSLSAGSGTRTHTHKAQDPKSCLSTNFNIPAVESAKILIFPGKQKANGRGAGSSLLEFITKPPVCRLPG